MYYVSLAPSGAVRLHYNEFLSIDLPSDAVGMRILHDALLGAQRQQTKIAEQRMPTQAQVDEMTKKYFKERATPGALAIIKRFKL